MKYMMMSEGTQEMLWCSAMAYVEGFDDMEDDEKDDVLEDLADEYIEAAERLGYEFEDASCDSIEGIEDEDLEAVFAEIEQEFDSKYLRA